ncbi:structural maintenance of chromosomes protein 6-like isoform X2 [Biomphalaria glabrata]|nr:structural maintenance of chromosomes protein 6-like isoform X2 [Biomphalaria glabrata]XP_055886370.1 structural maintenance of chromosomes protein 6-like isoform X2 [Biomphalaria glabrata]XP_055886371.1 structural maintenance of chromosomes protein 6-like isoform X2 [Biomphalaria glabrata]
MQKRVLTQTNSLCSNEGKIKKLRKKSSVSESDEDENEDIIENSVVTSADISRYNQKDEPVAGIIRRISIGNFMCHNRLDVNLGTHVNFIVGRNGSGKSAIVTALVVGLGGKATATSRGSSIKNFVKTGKRSAWVEITLNNKGPDSFKPSVYGDKIIVKRKFSVDGGSSYNICSATGNTVSTKRDDLQRILDHLNIQVDNPVSVLNQDTSRNFLNTRSASDKFKFFMKATQLEQMSADYELVNKNKELTRNVIKTKEETLVAMRREVKVWENKFKNLIALTDLKEKIKLLQKEQAWALVSEKEKGLKPLEKTLLAEEAALPRFIDKVEQSKNDHENWKERHKHLEQRLISCVKEVKELEPLFLDKKKELQEAKEKLVPLANQLKSLERELTSTNRDCKQCQDRIKELKDIASHDYEAERLQRTVQITKLKSKLEWLESQKKVLENDADQYRNAVIKSKADLANLESELKAKQVLSKNITLNKQRLLAARNDRLKRFGEWMPTVMSKIQERKAHFHKIPKGPLGACFDLLDPKWALAVECCLKGLVSAFVCHDHSDERILEDIFYSTLRSKSLRPTIITCPFAHEVHDVSKNKAVNKNYPCVLDVIKSDDPVIINTLIDQRRLENVILIADRDEAHHVMLKSPPDKARECFTETGDQAFSHPTFRYYANENYNVRYLMSDVQEQIKKMELDEKKIENEKKSIIEQIYNCQQDIQQNQAEEKKCRSELTKISQSISSITFEVNELQAHEDPDPVDVKTLEEEVENYKAKINELKAKREQILLEKTSCDENYESVKRSYSQLETSIREKSDNGLPLREEINQAQNELEKMSNAVKHYSSKLKEQQRKIQEAKEKVEQYKLELETDRAKTLEFCAPVQTSRSPDSIQSEINQIKRRINEQEVQQGNETEITATYKEKKDSLERVRKEVGQLQIYLNKLDEVMARRDIAYQKMRKLIANRAKYYFLLQMSQRSYTGKMNFDFEKETLEILVNTSQESSNRVGTEVKDLKSLSGGERSFSTVCFILSLWEAMESPFRCLDEFDIFMDMVNRRISMDMMMATADMHKNQQFIFLTPQDMSSVRTISNVKIYRMQDPERNQVPKLPSTQP